MRRTKEEAAITRQEVLNAALTVFGAKGYSASTLEQIATEAGVTRGAIYWHFGSKAELYNSLIKEYSARGTDITQEAISEGGSLVDILRRIFVRLLTAIEEEENLRAVMEIHLFKTELSADLQAGRQEQVDAGEALLVNISEAMSQGINAGILRADIDPIDMARSFMAFQNGIIYLWLMDPSAFSLSQTAEGLADILLKGILAQE